MTESLNILQKQLEAWKKMEETTVFEQWKIES